MKTRFSNLDFFRTLFAVMVALLHFNPPQPFAAGYIAVDFFFVLSGFVLTHSNIDKNIGFENFMLRRVLRLFPLAVISMASFLAVTYMLANVPDPKLLEGAEGIWSAFASFLLIGSVGLNSGPPINFVTWSVSVELFASAILFVRIFYKSPIVKIASLIVPIVIYAHLYQTLGQVDAHTAYDPVFMTSYGMQRGIADILIGSALYDVYCALHLRYPANRLSTSKNILATVAEVCLIYWIIYAINTFAHTKVDFAIIISLCFLLLIVALKYGYVGIILDNRFFGHVGDLSYALYLFQLHVLIFCQSKVFQENIYDVSTLSLWWRGALFLTLLSVVSLVVHILLERTTSKAGKRWLATFDAPARHRTDPMHAPADRNR